jgi:hypothetical protein
MALTTRTYNLDLHIHVTPSVVALEIQSIWPQIPPPSVHGSMVIKTQTGSLGHYMVLLLCDPALLLAFLLTFCTVACNNIPATTPMAAIPTAFRALRLVDSVAW